MATSSHNYHIPLMIITIFFFYPPLIFSSAQSISICRTSCGDIPIKYPFGIDDGCGSPFYRHLLVCSNTGHLSLRTPSGRYPVRRISYSDPHLLISDPFMWDCIDGEKFRPTRPFSLDTSTHFSLSTQNDYLFFNCSEDKVIVAPKPLFCEHFPDRCESSCDSSSYLCRHLPECGSSALGKSSCCSYYPKATESLRLMLKYCSSYTSINWRRSGEANPYDYNEVAEPEYGVRVDFDLEVTRSCLLCEDTAKGGGRCGFDTQNQSFVCLCDDHEGMDNNYNATTYCKDPRYYSQQNHGKKIGIINAGSAVAAASVVGAVIIILGIGGFCLWKVRSHKPVTHGVQTNNENRLF
ncbi:uncharacterized protein LOC124927432 [Impatiens glandulifera]|uniref:uncharacterized protein LOC124927432 n=1 Tax=Impatiens glandulifera TaxID=253017 RepID=UPI001FB052C0|nr:uncharacterized protein LOC124927432 [Impatiens glandulifera]